MEINDIMLHHNRTLRKACEAEILKQVGKVKLNQRVQYVHGLLLKEGLSVAESSVYNMLRGDSVQQFKKWAEVLAVLGLGVSVVKKG